MLVRTRLAFSILLLSILSASAQMYQGRELVKAELLADTSTIVPGKPFTVGVLLHMQPHWHTYWKFSGDAGLPSEIKWELPPGWKAGEIEWPIPKKLLDPGDIQTYGYNDEVMLLQEITPPDSLGNAPVKISAQVNWLVCERLCIPGSANLSLTLARSTSAAPANAELFARWRKTLPQNPPNDLSIQTAHRPNELSITLKTSAIPAGTNADFFPLPDENIVVGHPKTEWRGNELIVSVPFETNPPNELRGLLVFGDGIAWNIGSTSTTQTAAPILKTAAARGLWTFLFFGFIGGLILNVMPCVLPVISLKVFGFVQHAGQDRHLIFRSGLAFVAGSFAGFLGLALGLIALKAAGHQVTWAAQFTNPYFILGLSVLVLVFALNLLGVFEINPPQSVMRLAGSTASEGELGSFFQGVFATVLATPCTAPFLGTALGFAFTQSSLVILAMFAAIAAGMGAPYLLLSIQPAWLRFLPKPGAWMEYVKQLMGFLLLATLLFLLYVLGAQRGSDALVWAASFLLAISVACWMKGKFFTPFNSRLTKGIALVLMSILVIASAFYFVGDKFRFSKIDIVQTSGDWQMFTPERLQNELDQNHAVFVDFTAAWCLTCKFNEKTVLESAQIRDAFKQRAITKLKADWTNGDPAITKLLQQFGRPGVPMYVLYPGKAAEPFVFPELLTKNLILEKLETITRSTIASQ